MLVSRAWLSDYVRLDEPAAALAERLLMAGLNLEALHGSGDDAVIELEVTSNRPDCLCHLGVARETAALFGRNWNAPNPQPASRGADIATAAKVAWKPPPWSVIAATCCGSDAAK